MMRPLQTLGKRFYSATTTNMAAKKLQVGWVGVVLSAKPMTRSVRIGLILMST